MWDLRRLCDQVGKCGQFALNLLDDDMSIIVTVAYRTGFLAASRARDLTGTSMRLRG